MCPARRTHPARRRLRLLTAVATAAAIGSLLLGQAPVEPAPPAPAGREAVEMVAATKVELLRRKGFITGDGRTVYVANGTEFRPRRTRVAVPPRVRARAWVVVDLDTGRLLGKHRARTHLPQASTMKLLTAVTATRTIPRGTTYRVTRFDTSQVCSCSGIRRGRVYRRDALLKAMLLPSGNDAAEAVAGAHPRGRRAFYRAMNRVASRIGARDTVARNASGLTAPGSHSSARDLVLLLRAALADDTVRGILGMRSAVVATANGRHRHRVWRSTDYVNTYPRSLGKSGWTTPAQNTLVVATEIDGRRIAAASLGAPSGYSTSGARALTEWASENLTGLKAVGRLPRS
jgi:D-alanyl-D-alanine carboxypeptidase (penicillin-binding protein 5/6)